MLPLKRGAPLGPELHHIARVGYDVGTSSKGAKPQKVVENLKAERVLKMLFDLVMFVVHMVTTHDYVPAMDLWGFGEDSLLVNTAMSVSEAFGLTAPAFVGGGVQ